MSGKQSGRDVVDAEFTDVDAEFTEIDQLGPPSWPSYKQPPNKPQMPWAMILVVTCLGIGGAYFFYAHRDTKSKQTSEWPMGRVELLDCSYATSLDGRKELNLFENQRAVLYDKSVKTNGKYRAVHGSWTFDQATKQYAISLDSATASYSLVEPDNAACMLVKGDLATANLIWFATNTNDGSDYGPSYDEAHEPH